MQYTRNEFLKLLGLSATATLASVSGFSAPARSNDHQRKEGSALKLGLASYTLRKFNLDEVIKISRRLGLSSIALKSMHMPLESPADEIKKMADKIRSAGLTLYGAGVIYMKSAQEIETAFAYAANAGLEMIIGVPNHDLLP